MTQDDDSLSLSELHMQIKALEDRAEQVRLKEFEAVIKDIKEKIALYKISAKDLGFDEKNEVAQRNNEIPVKYKDDQGNSWIGKGARPLWLKAKLKEGHQIEEFKVQ